jgi:hypothetical protein
VSVHIDGGQIKDAVARAVTVEAKTAAQAHRPQHRV